MKIVNFKAKNNFMFLTPAKQLNLLNKQPAKVIETAFDLLCELLNDFDVSQIKQALNIHQGTINRWLANKEVPDNYFNDLNGTVESQIIFYFICHFWYKFLLFLAKYVQYVSKNSQNFFSKLAKN